MRPKEEREEEKRTTRVRPKEVREKEKRLARVAREESSRRVILLWQKEHIPDPEIPEALQIPPSLWGECKARGDSPPLFMIGRRLFVRTADLRAWLHGKAAQGYPGNRKLRNAAAQAERAAA
jgi:hypothetical protein